MLRIAICDDDMNFTGTFENMVEQEAATLGVCVETEVFSDGSTLVGNIQKGYQYDIIFLDIEMERVNGIAAARSIRETDKTVVLVYVSGYEQYLKELFEVEPFRFLLKPLDKRLFSHYFADACEKVWGLNAYYQFTFNKEIRKIPLRSIVYFASSNRIIRIFTKNGTSEQFYGILSNVEKDLLNGKQRFLRIHQSFLVNYDYIKKMNFSNLILSVGEGKEISLGISADRQKAVRAQLCWITNGKAVIK